jgi:serine/threonine protein kinase
MGDQYPMSRGDASEASDPLAGTPYAAVERLGAGGMGEIFLVEHRALRRRFVAKLLRESYAASPQLVDRMRLEAQSLGRLRHPHIVGVAGFGATEAGRPYLVLEHLEGRTLAEELADRTRLSVSEALKYTGELLSALAAAHDLGIVHRDVKPANLFLWDGPGGRSLKVLDFGVARILPNAHADAPMPLCVPTDTGIVIGTPQFVSPEGALGTRVDARADLYSAALILYTMLAGRGPFEDVRDQEQILRAHASEPPPPPSAFTEGPLPEALEGLILQALEKDPEHRFTTARAFSAALARVATDLSEPIDWLTTRSASPESHLKLPDVELSGRERSIGRLAPAPAAMLPEPTKHHEPAPAPQPRDPAKQLTATGSSRLVSAFLFGLAMLVTAALVTGLFRLVRSALG